MLLNSSSPISVPKISTSSTRSRELAQPCLSAEFPASQTQVLRAWPRQARKLCSSVSAGKVVLPACSTCLAQMNLTASPPTIQPAPQPEVTSITGAPLVQGTAAGDHVFVAFGAAPGGPVAVWNASAPNQFLTSVANASATDLGAASDGSMFAFQSKGVTEMRAADLSLTSIPFPLRLSSRKSRGACSCPVLLCIFQARCSINRFSLARPRAPA